MSSLRAGRGRVVVGANRTASTYLRRRLRRARSFTFLVALAAASLSVPAATVEFIATDPIPLNDAVACKVKTGATALSDIKPDDLANHSALVTYRDATGQVSTTYVASSAGKNSRELSVLQDYQMYRLVRLEPGWARVGVGTRIKVDLSIRSKKINLSGLFPIAVAASRGKTEGTLSVEVLGMTSRDITNLIPLPAQLSPDAVITAIQASAAIKTRIWGSQSQGKSSTQIEPHIIAVSSDVTPQHIETFLGTTCDP